MHLKLLVRFTPDVVKRHLSPVLIPAIATKQVAAALVARGRIAAAPQRIRLKLLTTGTSGHAQE